jgi:surfeit locus 1 family protein
MSGNAGSSVGWGWAFKGRWLVGWLLVALVAVTFIRLGFWQLDRLQWRRGVNATIQQRQAEPAANLTSLDPSAGADALEYLPVEADGTYDTSREAILYGRARNGQAGNHLLTPLRLDDGSSIIVDRGWVPLDAKTPGAMDASTPDGRVSVEGILLPPESEDRRPDADTVKDVSLVQLRQRVDGELWPVYILLRSQAPQQTGPFPEPVPEPELSEGPHLSYAVQWFTFTIIGLVGWALLLRRERRDREAGTAEHGGAGP